MTLSLALGANREPASAMQIPFDWIEQAMENPKVLLLGNAGSGRAQYLASLPYAQIDWNDRRGTIAVMPSAADAVARLADAIYHPGHAPPSASPHEYRIVYRQAGTLDRGTTGRQMVTLTDIPHLVVNGVAGPEIRLNEIVWRDDAVVRIGPEFMPVREHVAGAVGLVFTLDPAVPAEHNVFVAEILEQIEHVLERWRQAGAANVPSVQRRVPVAVIATKSDTLPPGHALEAADPPLETLVGSEIAERIRAAGYSPYCGTVSAWGDEGGVRFAGTRFDPTGVLEPVRAIFARLPRLLNLPEPGRGQS